MFIHRARYNFSTMLLLSSCTLLGCLVRLVLADNQSGGSVAIECAPNQPNVCFLKSMNFPNPNQGLVLVGADDKKNLNIKSGRVDALRAEHCTASLATFEKVSIGRVGLRELCIAPSFVQVSAEHNLIRELLPAGGDSSSYRLEVLKLSYNQLESVDRIQPFHALRELYLDHNALSTLDMASFAKLAKLQKLHLAHNRLNQITSVTSELALPALSVIELQNNTLTDLKLHQWSLPALERLELASNNLTNVRGLDQLSMLSEVSLASNRWQCTELDQMLEVLEKNDVTVRDGDRSCGGIRNSSICCTAETQPTEGALLDELNKFTELQNRYNDAERTFSEKIQEEIDRFGELVASMMKEPSTETPKPPIDPKPDPDGVEAGSGNGVDGEQKQRPCECSCSEENLKSIQTKLETLDGLLNANNATLVELRDNQSQLSFHTVLAKHEFRTAVRRGEHKLKELSSMLAMLREHVKELKFK